MMLNSKKQIVKYSLSAAGTEEETQEGTQNFIEYKWVQTVRLGKWFSRVHTDFIS